MSTSHSILYELLVKSETAEMAVTQSAEFNIAVAKFHTKTTTTITKMIHSQKVLRRLKPLRMHAHISSYLIMVFPTLHCNTYPKQVGFPINKAPLLRYSLCKNINKFSKIYSVSCPFQINEDSSLKNKDLSLNSQQSCLQTKPIGGTCRPKIEIEHI